MHDLKMTDNILANSEQNYGVWKMQDWKNDGQTLCQMAVRCVVHLLTWLCVCIFDMYLANYRKTLFEFD